MICLFCGLTFSCLFSGGAGGANGYANPAAAMMLHPDYAQATHFYSRGYDQATAAYLNSSAVPASQSSSYYGGNPQSRTDYRSSQYRNNQGEVKNMIDMYLPPQTVMAQAAENAQGAQQHYAQLYQSQCSGDSNGSPGAMKYESHQMNQMHMHPHSIPPLNHMN